MPHRRASGLLLCCLLLPSCTRFDVINALSPGWNHHRMPDIPYGQLPRQRLDVYVPKQKQQAPRPVVIFFYGGAWQTGSKRDYRFVAQALTSAGFIAVLPDYRLYPDATFPAFVEDGAMAVKWVSDHAPRFGGDPSRIYLLGHSAGAHIAAMLTLDERYLQRIGADPRAIRATTALAGPFWLLPLKGAFARIFPSPRQQQWIEPHAFVDGAEPPMLLIHGGSDKWVPQRNSEGLYQIIDEKGGAARLVEYPKRGHAELVLALACGFRWLAPVRHEVIRFFQTH